MNRQQWCVNCGAQSGYLHKPECPGPKYAGSVEDDRAECPTCGSLYDPETDACACDEDANIEQAIAEAEADAALAAYDDDPNPYHGTYSEE